MEDKPAKAAERDPKLAYLLTNENKIYVEVNTTWYPDGMLVPHWFVHMDGTVRDRKAVGCAPGCKSESRRLWYSLHSSGYGQKDIPVP